MTAPINVKLKTPTSPPHDWGQQAAAWTQLNADIDGNNCFHPLTVKCGYVLGVIYHLCQSVDILLRHRSPTQGTYLPAYTLFAGGIDLLGRCIHGIDDPRRNGLTQGLQWLEIPSFTAYTTVPESTVVVTTKIGGYSIDDLRDLRNFCAHGQATSSAHRISVYQPFTIDLELLEEMRPKLRDGLEHYWYALTNEDNACNNLAHALVVPLRGDPTLSIWKELQGDAVGKYQSITDIFDQFNWSIK